MKKTITIHNAQTGETITGIGEQAVEVAFAAMHGMRLDGHKVVDALRLKSAIRCKTKCGKTFTIKIPLPPDASARTQAPLSCEQCREN